MQTTILLTLFQGRSLPCMKSQLDLCLDQRLSTIRAGERASISHVLLILTEFHQHVTHGIKSIYVRTVFSVMLYHESDSNISLNDYCLIQTSILVTLFRSRLLPDMKSQVNGWMRDSQPDQLQNPSIPRRLLILNEFYVST